MNESPLATPLDGLWQMIRAEHDGDVAPELVVQRTILQLSGGIYQVMFDGTASDQGTFEVNDAKGSRILLLRGTTGVNSGRLIRCVYQQVGDRLRICFGLNGIQPTDFTTAPGQSRYLATYRRLSGAK